MKLPFIQKRVTGLTDINEFCQAVLSHSIQQSRDCKFIEIEYVSLFFCPFTFFLSNSYLVDWIKEKKLIEYVFGESGHPELIKRSKPILRLLAIKEELTDTHLDIMWNASIVCFYLIHSLCVLRPYILG